MTSEEVQLVSQSIAFHPVAVVAGLMVLMYISRRNYYKSQTTAEKMNTKSSQEIVVEDNSNSQPFQTLT